MSQPGFFFYTGDWLKDTRVLSPAVRGAWIDLLCVMHEHGGEIRWSLDDLAQFWTVELPDCNRFVTDLSRLNIAVVTFESQGMVTIVCRKMKRAVIERENSRLRKQKQRDKTRKHRDSHGPVTPKSGGSSSSESSSSSSSLKKEPKAPPSAGSLKTEKPDFEPLVKMAAELAGKDLVAAQKLCQWTVSMIRTLTKEPPERTAAVVRLCLENVKQKLANGYEITSMWGLLTTIFDKERTKYMQGPENEAHKSGPIPDSVKGLIRGIG